MRTVSKILSIAILMTGFASCSKMDRVFDGGQAEIAMRPVMSSMSKAPVTGTTYPETGTFGVIASYSPIYGHGQEWAYEDADALNASVIKYIDRKEFKKDGDTFGGVDPCYWPHQGSLVFAGYSPYDLDGTPSFTPATKTLLIDNFISDGQTDLMYFLPEVSNGSLKGVLDSRSSVSAAFSHALALLELNVCGIEGDETVRITGVSVSSWRSQGDFSVIAGSDPSWNGIVTGEGEKTVYTDPGAVISHDTPLTIHALVIPGGTSDITITYDVVAAQTYSGRTATISAADISEFAEWSIGKKYIYDITLASKFIVVDPSVGDYGSGIDADLEI